MLPRRAVPARPLMLPRRAVPARPLMLPRRAVPARPLMLPRRAVPARPLYTQIHAEIGQALVKTYQRIVQLISVSGWALRATCGIVSFQSNFCFAVTNAFSKIFPSLVERDKTSSFRDCPCLSGGVSGPGSQQSAGHRRLSGRSGSLVPVCRSLLQTIRELSIHMVRTARWDGAARLFPLKRLCSVGARC